MPRTLTRKRCRAKRGHRTRRFVTVVNGQRVSVLPVVSLDGAFACTAKFGSIKSKNFLNFILDVVVSSHAFAASEFSLKKKAASKDESLSPAVLDSLCRQRQLSSQVF